MNNYVLIEIDSSRYLFVLNILHRYKVNIYKIYNYRNNIRVKISYKDYLKIKTIKIFNITIVKRYGIISIKHFISKYKITLIILLISYLFCYLLSHLILEIKIESNNKYIRDLVKTELSNNGIKKYSFSKNFYKNEKIVKKILDNNKDTLEWLEIEKNGTKYIIKVEERKLNKNTEGKVNRHIVAKKNGIITSIVSDTGEIIKKVNDYVLKDEIIISGFITKNDEVKGIVSASGKVFGEVWYKVNVSLPIIHNEMLSTGKLSNLFSINIFDKYHDLNKYKNKEYSSIKTLKNPLLPIEIGIFKVKELTNTSSIFTYDNLYLSALELARNKLMSSLNKESKIIYKKCLKINEIDSKIDIDIFFKVIEDITSYQEIKEEINIEKE